MVGLADAPNLGPTGNAILYTLRPIKRAEEGVWAYNDSKSSLRRRAWEKDTTARQYFMESLKKYQIDWVAEWKKGEDGSSQADTL
jgi:hypothetical protein